MTESKKNPYPTGRGGIRAGGWGGRASRQLPGLPEAADIGSSVVAHIFRGRTGKRNRVCGIETLSGQTAAERRVAVFLMIYCRPLRRGHFFCRFVRLPRQA